MAQEIKRLPTHIAITPDGNRRWAEKHGVSIFSAHDAGAKRVHDVVEQLIDYQIKYLTLWGFSSDNWKRSNDEVAEIFHLLKAWIERDTPWLHNRKVKLCHIGRIQPIPQYLQSAINQGVALTRNNDGMTLALAFNYGGRPDIIDAIRRLMDKGVPSHEVDEEMFSTFLDTNGMPDVDLVIRTSGNFRQSNFLLWQTAYSEYYFTPTLWPDFDTKELEKALQSYSERPRRFGGD